MFGIIKVTYVQNVNCNKRFMQEVAKETRRFIFSGKSSSATPGVTRKKKRNRNKTKTKLLEANFKLELIPFGYPIKDKSIFTAHRTQKVEYCKLPLTSSPIYAPAPSPVIDSSTCKKNTSDYKPGHPLAFIFMFILK